MSDLDRYQYGYDQNSNRLWKANVVGTAAVPAGLDEAYSYDNLNRLTQMQRGVLSGGVITGTPSREMDYTLDLTGNWSAYLTKSSGTTDLNQTRSQSPVNEITAITSTPGWATPPAYDAAGNMTSFPQPASPSSTFTTTYDAWNRMVSVSASGSTVAQYQYDGTDRRAVKLTYSGGSLSETRHFYYTSDWRDIEERVGTSTLMDKQFVWGVRYVDELICRDDATPLRLYAAQDANFNVTALINTTGTVQERFVYDPYGNSVVLTYAWATTADAYAWTQRFTGQSFDPETGLYYYRARYYQPLLGIFVGRDPIDSKSRNNLYEYAASSPSVNLDATGLATFTWGQCYSYYGLQWWENLVARNSRQWEIAARNVLTTCINSLGVPKDDASMTKFFECIAAIPGSTGLGSLAANILCCETTDTEDTIDPLQRQANNPSQINCLPACMFKSCTNAFDPSTWSLKGAIKAGQALEGCECDCSDPKYQPT